MTHQLFGYVASFLLLIAAASAGCRSGAHSPFALRPTQQAAAPQQGSTESASLSAAADVSKDTDAITQQIAAESRELSRAYSAEANPELANYTSTENSMNATSSEWNAQSAPAATRTGSFSSSAARSSSGCSSGCCH